MAEAIVVVRRTFKGQLALRVPPLGEARTRVERWLNAPLPDPGRLVASAGRWMLWLGPDSWLVLDNTRDGWWLERDFRTEIGSCGCSATDVSSQRIVFDLSGAAVGVTLSKGCPVDLHPRAFRPSACIVTRLDEAPVILARLPDETGIRLLVRRSYARYLTEWLADATAEFPPAETPRTDISVPAMAP